MIFYFVDKSSSLFSLSIPSLYKELGLIAPIKMLLTTQQQSTCLLDEITKQLLKIL